MALNADILLDRMQLKQKLKKWQMLSFMLIAITLLALVLPVAGGKSGVSNKDYIARIKIEGMILDDPYRDEVIADLIKDKDVKAVIVSIDSPGGTTAGGETLYSQLREMSEAGKPVAVVMKTLAASGGYMTALGGDYIIARRGTITGSIGVLMETAEVTELAENLGIQFNTIKTSELKASPSPFEKITPEAREAIQNVIDDFYNYFVDLVAERRNMDRETALKLADGRIYTGSQAFKNGLIDEIGGEREAVKWLNTKKKISKDLKVEDVSTEKPKDSLRDVLFGDINESKIYQTLTTQGFLAIWKP